MSNSLPDHVAKQIEALEIDRERPLVLSDADEVLLQFVKMLEVFLDEQGLYLDLTSFRLFGNVKMKDSHEVVDRAAVMALLAEFFTHKAAECLPVPGAAEALAALSPWVQIVVVSNVPMSARQARIDALAGHGMPYPLIANEGEKGPVVREIAARHAGPVVFLDDLPQNIASVATHAAQVHRIHFVADQRLRPLLDQAEGAHARIDEWPKALDYISAHFLALGFDNGGFGHGVEE